MIYVTGGIIYLLTGLYALSNKALRESKLTDHSHWHRRYLGSA